MEMIIILIGKDKFPDGVVLIKSMNEQQAGNALTRDERAGQNKQRKFFEILKDKY